ncbi:cellular morphogenesis-related protein [Lichtheimia corymbifera JMRC:FSU:9682]|uniref:Cellular morphogenesis-related protein n=1 Tax=Lichtheimia corymbifera JMRC:FSU:9682 TaxID=1263082 RepID=A0A068S693_9FUNG|nr:cellular morphogenesis-related protein [Lichtheimia corymbifera JMRC:FSU:9682]
MYEVRICRYRLHGGFVGVYGVIRTSIHNWLTGQLIKPSRRHCAGALPFSYISLSTPYFVTITSNLSKLEKTTSTDHAYQSDPRFRKYVQLIEKNLNSFDAVNEWADIISFLGRLLKSFQAYPQFPVIPRKHTVAKRLAQCLNPGFPAGVHQKTLDVYAYILETIGVDQLADDLAIWSLGLFPFVQYAAMQVKPQLLAIFEKYYFPLKKRLRPSMRGFIIALLPALDEEGSEFFDKS